MLELPALQFISVVVEIRRLATVLESFHEDAQSPAEARVREQMAGTIAFMRDHLATIAAQSAWVAANRLHERLIDHAASITYGEIHKQIDAIEGRFADHLEFIRLFVVRPEQISLLGTAVEILGESTAGHFTSVWFDCEEAAKCILVLRPTAAVFHAMRMLEIGIRAFAARLNIPDPVRPAERNWGVFLRTIRAKIDADFPASKRLPSSEGAFLEALYATLDAVKNPWRNEVMHVEGVYTDAEAGFIVLCVIRFIQKMATSFDEQGRPVEPPMLSAVSA